jgi:glycosyltransferase involved in cell wall biosynthesis
MPALDLAPAATVLRPPLATAPISRTVRLLAGRPKVSLTMIVRDESEHLPRCLQSVSGIFDEIVVVDTGSTDRTKEIAASFGARVFDFPWIDDFAAARNESLRHATGDYVFWLDADDVIQPPEREKLAAFLSRLPTDPVAYRCRLEMVQPDGSVQETLFGGQLRLFPRLPAVRWKYAVHETVNPSLARAGIHIRDWDVAIRHTGSASVEHIAAGIARDARLIPGLLAERPDDPYVQFLWGRHRRDPDVFLSLIHRWQPSWGVPLAYLERAYNWAVQQRPA